MATHLENFPSSTQQQNSSATIHLFSVSKNFSAGFIYSDHNSLTQNFPSSWPLDQATCPPRATPPGCSALHCGRGGEGSRCLTSKTHGCGSLGCAPAPLTTPGPVSRLHALAPRHCEARPFACFPVSIPPTHPHKLWTSEAGRWGALTQTPHFQRRKS